MAAATSTILMSLGLGLAAANTVKTLTDKGPKPPVLPAPPAPIDTRSRTAAGALQRKKAKGTRSARDTLLTGPAGLAAEPAPLRKTLLGS